MCDTAVVLRPGRVLFAKNSDRDANEAQLLEWHPRRQHPSGSHLQCTWIAIPQVRETCAVLLSRPFWMWGAEMGTNEHGVVIGNEAVFTHQPYADEGLTGMDLVRLGLERARCAEEALAVLVQLLETHGQGGGCGLEARSFTYHNSFLLADAQGAFVLESAGREVATERVGAGARTLSNALSIEPFARRHADRLRARASGALRRRACTLARARHARSAGDMMALLRDHGAGETGPRYALLNGGMNAPCMHAGGLLVNSQTTASWVSELTSEGAHHWATGTAAPCTALFKPVAPGEPLALGPAPDDRADEASLWWRHERLHRRALQDPARLLPLFAKARDRLEAAWLASPPSSRDAFAAGDAQLAEWTALVAREAPRGPDARPLPARRFWALRNARAGLAL